MHGVALASINNTENQRHDHTGITAMLIDTTYNTSTDNTIGSATHHEVLIVRRHQRPGTASTPSSFFALEDDMSGVRTGDGITTCIAGSSPSTRDQLTFCLVVQRRRDGPPHATETGRALDSGARDGPRTRFGTMHDDAMTGSSLPRASALHMTF